MLQHVEAFLLHGVMKVLGHIESTAIQSESALDDDLLLRILFQKFIHDFVKLFVIFFRRKVSLVTFCWQVSILAIGRGHSFGRVELLHTEVDDQPVFLREKDNDEEKMKE